MTIEELNKLIKEELNTFLKENNSYGSMVAKRIRDDIRDLPKNYGDEANNPQTQGTSRIMLKYAKKMEGLNDKEQVKALHIQMNKEIHATYGSYSSFDNDEFLYEGEDDEIEVTTDEPSEEGEAMDLLRQIYDMIKPEVEGEEEEPEMDMEEPEDEDIEDEDIEDEEGEEETLDEGLSGGEGQVLGWMIDMADKLGFTTVGDFRIALAAAGIFTVLSIITLSSFGGPALAKAKSMWKGALQASKAGGKSAASTEPEAAPVSEADGEKLTLTSAAKAVFDFIKKTPGGTSNLSKLTKMTDIPALDQLASPGVQGEKGKTDENNSLNESVDMTARFKKLANIKG